MNEQDNGLKGRFTTIKEYDDELSRKEIAPGFHYNRLFAIASFQVTGYQRRLSALAKLILEGNRAAVKQWARGIKIEFDVSGGDGLPDIDLEALNLLVRENEALFGALTRLHSECEAHQGPELRSDDVWGPIMQACEDAITFSRTAGRIPKFTMSAEDVEALRDVTAAAENMWLHHKRQMTQGDALQRNKVIVAARESLERIGAALP